MRITLIKYISKEIWSIFLTCLLVLLFIVLASQVLDKVIEPIVNYGASIGDAVNLILCLIPRFILLSLPAACLMAVLLSFIRMASDNEIIALHSSGISLYQLMPPVVIFSLICFLFAGFLTLFWAPYGNRAFESVFVNLMKTGIESQIKEGVFFDEIDDVVFYVNSYSPKDRVMKDVFFVQKKGDKVITIIAKKAKIFPDRIRFMHGKGFTENREGSSESIGDFPDFFDYKIPIDNMLGSSESNEIEPEGMYFDELVELINNTKENIKKNNNAKLILYEMFSIPVAVLLMGIAGAPLGAQIRARGRTKGIIISLILFLCYYIIFMSVRLLCENGTINPAIGVWLPVLFLLIICILLLVRSAGNLFIGIINRLTSAVTSLKT